MNMLLAGPLCAAWLAAYARWPDFSRVRYEARYIDLPLTDINDVALMTAYVPHKVDVVAPLRRKHVKESSACIPTF